MLSIEGALQGTSRRRAMPIRLWRPLRPTALIQDRDQRGALSIRVCGATAHTMNSHPLPVAAFVRQHGAAAAAGRYAGPAGADARLSAESCGPRHDAGRQLRKSAAYAVIGCAVANH